MNGIATGLPANIVAGVLALLVLGYLFAVLLRPDRF
ncbi:K+-transporting ATPase KdpF subunit [Tamaricihabitans halophyticus]|uniref:K+-transporting ATPase KdpF subunit n=1 Tax=Tamaricihabitans halophyticus TaxID=1262583 RepID=A0A4R2QQJ2_9PSEU|nr:K(+)-transporting ATPase subunit F [Tamaricihabitans halophyticus]TCP52013.1 K+-transporting ATPase KdpF subunit [Tamaricihabitans halophyticus]